MSGRLIGIFILVAAVLAGGLIYYLQVFAYYDEVVTEERSQVSLTMLAGEAGNLPVKDYQSIDKDSSPLGYRACFTVSNSLATMTETYVLLDHAVPLQAPGWFECFDAQEVGEALETGRALAFLGQAEIGDGVDRVVAVMNDGRGFAWHQLNEKYQD
jgi:hypothetical protein